MRTLVESPLRVRLARESRAAFVNSSADREDRLEASELEHLAYVRARRAHTDSTTDWLHTLDEKEQRSDSGARNELELRAVERDTCRAFCDDRLEVAFRR